MQTASLKIKISGVKSCVLTGMSTLLGFLCKKKKKSEFYFKKVAFLLCLTKLIILTLWIIDRHKIMH